MVIKFKDQLSWQQAELLMQPTLIRVIDNLRKQLEKSPWQGTYLETELPYPGYQLCLKQGEVSHTIDLWQICFQVCFENYQPHLADQEVKIDLSLLDDNGDVDWQTLETKTQQTVNLIFTNLPQ